MNKDKSNLKSFRKTFRLDEASLKEIDTFKRIHRLNNESEALRSIITEYKVLKEQGKSEKEVVNKALGLDYPDDCPDMLPIEGKPNLRQCVCLKSKRPVSVSLVKGKYIVDNPRICRRCKALGYRKSKKEVKSSQYNGGKRYKKRDRQVREFRGYRNGIWYPSDIWKG